MAASEQTVELVSTKEIELFLPLMREIDFGDAFLLSMLHWCGIRQEVEAAGLLASLSPGREIPDYRCIGPVQTTRHASLSLLARLVRNSSSIPPPRLRHSGDLPIMRNGTKRLVQGALGLHRP